MIISCENCLLKLEGTSSNITRYGLVELPFALAFEYMGSDGNKKMLNGIVSFLPLNIENAIIIRGDNPQRSFVVLGEDARRLRVKLAVCLEQERNRLERAHAALESQSAELKSLGDENQK